MADSYTTVERRGWLSRIGGALKGILLGIVMFGISFPLLWWNEGRAVATARGLEQGAASVIAVPADHASTSNDGRLVHVSGTVTTDDVLADPQFDVRETALHLTREVTMFQWVENVSSNTEKQLGGSEQTTRTYSYRRAWSRSVKNSDEFQVPDGHRNPGRFAIPAASLSAARAQLGAFELNESQIAQLSGLEPLALTDANVADMEGASIESMDGRQGAYISSAGGTPADPQVGDLFITFEILREGPYSLVAQQNGSTFQPHLTPNGTRISLVSPGIVSADLMFDDAQRGNTFFTWLLRGAGLALMYFGLTLAFRILPVLGDVVPLFGTLVEVGVSLIAGALTLVLGGATIAIAWVWFRPLVGIVLLAVVAGVAGYLLLKVKQAPPPAEPVEAT